MSNLQSRFPKQLTVRVDGDVAKRLRAMSRDLGLSRSDLVREAINRGMDGLVRYWSEHSAGQADWKVARRPAGSAGVGTS